MYQNIMHDVGAKKGLPLQSAFVFDTCTPRSGLSRLYHGHLRIIKI